MSAQWKATLDAFEPVKAACAAGHAAAARDAIRAALETAGLDVSSVAPMDDAALAGRPEAWLILHGTDMDEGAFTPYVVPLDAIDGTMRGALERVANESLSTADVADIDPVLWRAWVRVALATGSNDYDDFSGVLDDDDEVRTFDDDEVASLHERFAGRHAKTGDRGLVTGVLDARFVGATFFFERL